MSELTKSCDPPALRTQDSIVLLDPRSETGQTAFDAAGSMPMWAATISAGWKEGDTPKVSRDGKIVLHEDQGAAPGIKAALEAGEYKRLTITMLSDDIQECIKQLFCSYDRMKIFGDATKLTVMEMKDGKQVRRVYEAGTDGFKKALVQCKANTFVPFALAEWDGDVARIAFPDGFIPYRLRFGSLNSARSFASGLAALKQLTGGKLTGVPLELTLVKKWVMCPDLSRRQVPVWSIRLKHPKGLSLTAGFINRVLTEGIRDAAAMALPPPSEMDADAIEAAYMSDAAIDASFADGDDLRTATAGNKAKDRIADFFRAMQSTVWVQDEKRAELVQRMADAAGVVLEEPSLSLLADIATDEEWGAATAAMTEQAHYDLHKKAPQPQVEDSDPYNDPEPPTPKEGVKPPQTKPPKQVVEANEFIQSLEFTLSDVGAFDDWKDYCRDTLKESWAKCVLAARDAGVKSAWSLFHYLETGEVREQNEPESETVAVKTGVEQ